MLYRQPTGRIEIRAGKYWQRWDVVYGESDAEMKVMRLRRDRPGCEVRVVWE